MRIVNEVFEEPVAVNMALFLKSKSSEILKLVERAEKLAVTIQEQPLEYILCHADIHGWNLIVDILKTIPVESCCHDLAILLASDIQIDSQYVNQVKKFFLEHWHH